MFTLECDLFGNRGLQMSLVEMRPCRISMGSKSNDLCPSKKRRGPTNAPERRPCEDRGWVEWRCYKPRTSKRARSHQKLEEAREYSSPGASEGVLPCPHLLIWQRINSSCFKLPSLWYFVMAALEKEIYSNLNAEFQRIARRDKKTFLTDQCKEIEEKI